MDTRSSQAIQQTTWRRPFLSRGSNRPRSRRRGGGSDAARWTGASQRSPGWTGEWPGNSRCGGLASSAFAALATGRCTARNLVAGSLQTEI